MTIHKIAFILSLLCLKMLVFAQKAPETLVINGANLLENQALIAANDVDKKATLTNLLRERIKSSKRENFIP